MKRLVALLALLFASSIAFGQTPTVNHLCTNVVAYADFTSATVDVSGQKYLSVEIDWAGLTGTLNGSVKLQVSNSAGVRWTDKSGATNAVTTASASVVFSAVNVTEQIYRVVYTHGGITGGTINCYVLAKP